VGFPSIVEVTWVTEHRADLERAGLVVADVRWYLDGRSGLGAFTAGHVPGAVFVDLDRDLSGPGPPSAGRHPFPSPETFSRAMGALGIGPTNPVVAYDDTGGSSAGRLVWMLRILGRPAALLEGSQDAWPQELETGTGGTRVPVAVPAEPWPADRFVDHDGVAAAATSPDVTVLDARAPDRYRGENEVIDPRPGHVPGALNAPWAANLHPVTRKLRPLDDLRAHYAALGVTAGSDVVCYCGSGVSACVDLLALEHLGVTGARLFAPSWSGWSADPARPVTVGDE
jgi:thiosulfate/3-mercaptopyruvate sulfurtransferase